MCRAEDEQLVGVLNCLGYRESKFLFRVFAMYFL